MSATRIEWADAVWNPVTGCTPVSEGCAHCYAARMATRLRGRCGYDAERPFGVRLRPERLGEPAQWRQPRRVFVCSMGDLFHEDVPDGFSGAPLRWGADEGNRVSAPRARHAEGEMGVGLQPEMRQEEIMRLYVKPRFRRVAGLDFVLNAIRAGWRAVCRGCSGCHGCR